MSIDDFDLEFLFDDRNTVYHAMMLKRKVMKIVMDKNIALINDMVSVVSLLLSPLLGQDIPSDDGNDDDFSEVVDCSVDTTATETKLQVEAVTTSKMNANEPRIDVIHATKLLHRICGRCCCCSCRRR